MFSVKLIFVNLILFLCFNCTSKEDKPQKLSILSSLQNGDTLEIVSDDDLIWQPFTVELSVEELQKFYGNIFQVEDQGKVIKLQGKGNEIVLITNKSIENAEKLAEHHHSKVSSYSLEKAKISTPSIVLQYGIRVGMSKEAFFEILNFSSDVENSVNVVQFFDPPGDMIEQSYVFKDGKLEVIEMKSPY